jgi:DNA (cytosine-5)-methyltransferase 1
MTERSNNIFLSDGKLGDSLKHGSLFSGIGGFDLAAEWMGWKNIFHCEWNEFGQQILKHYWPKSISYEDITKTDFSIHRGKIDILTGGFPCQPYSTAGKRLGKEDDRHLWPEMLRAIREIAPKYVVGENVSGLLSWNGGLVFNEVQADLEAQGYEVQPCVLPAAAVNAPHKRARVWFVAYANKCATRPSGTSYKTKSNRSKNNDERSSRGKQAEQHIGCSDVYGLNTDTESKQSEWLQSKQREPGEKKQKQSGRSDCRMGNRTDTNTNNNRTIGKSRENEGTSKGKGLQERNEVQQLKEPNTIRPENTEVSTDTCNERLQRRKLNGTLDKKAKKQREQPSGSATERHQITDWEQWPTQSPICSGNDGISNQLDGITFPKWRQESIKGYGNAIVPQVAYQIFKALMETEAKEGRKN